MKRMNFQAKNEELSNHRATSHFQIADQILPRSTRAAHGSTTAKSRAGVARTSVFAQKLTSHRVNSLARAHTWRREDRAAGDGRVTPPLEKARGTSHAREDRRARPTRATERAIGAHESPGRASQIQIRARWVTRLARLAARRGRMSSDGSTSRGSPHRARAWTTPRRRGRYANVPTLHPTRTRMYHESSRVRQTNNHD